MKKEIENLSLPINSNIFIHGIKHELKVNELFKALNLLREAKDLIEKNTYNYAQACKENVTEYYDIMFEVEAKQNDLILEVNNAICKLISTDLLHIYLK